MFFQTPLATRGIGLLQIPVVGISVALLMGERYATADDWAALLACAVILFNGMRLLFTPIQEMMDVSAPPELDAFLRETAAGVKGVQGVETCRARKSGPGWYVDMHILMDGSMTVREGHEIAHAVKDRLLNAGRGILNALVHVEPLEAHPEVPVHPPDAGGPDGGGRTWRHTSPVSMP